MKILILSYGQFPNGGAFINRILGYTKGLIELGNEVKILLLSQQNDEKEVKYYSFIDYSLFSNINYNCKNKLSKFISYLLVNRNLSKHLKKNTYDIAYLYGMTFPLAHGVAKICKDNSLKIVNEQTEHPLVISNRTVFRKMYMKYFTHNLHIYFNGLVVISEKLKNYYSKLTHDKIPIKKINMFIDPSRFLECNNRNFFDFEYIAYAGIMYGNKDGVAELIISYKIVAKKFPNYKLVLIGDNNDKKRMEQIYQIISDDVKNNIIFTGRVNREMIPHYLNNARLLVLARPDNIQAEAGFPTKLGEYLATGIPVVVTDVGEINHFLSDKYNCFIAKNNEPDVFAAKMIEVLEDYKEALKVAERGKKIIYNEFNYLAQSKQLEIFFKEIAYSNKI